MSAVYMLSSVGERTPPCGTPPCVGFASLQVVCDELNDCACNVGL